MSAYSFLNTQASLIGPGGAISLGAHAGVAEEGITVEFLEEADDMKIGSGGDPMHTLNASKAGRVTVRLQKTSPTNGLLTSMMNYQRTASSLWGANILTLTDSERGDVYTCQSVAFTKIPSNTYAKVAGMLEWVLNVGIMDASLVTVD